MVSSRVDRYRDLRSGLKEEAGISREDINIVKEDYTNDENDDFLISVNRFFYKKNDNQIEDTLIEAKTFEQMRNENNEELNRALRSAKVSVGKSDKYNTRMDILNKIREPEKQVVRVNNFDNVKTSEFSKGYFVNPEAKANIDDVLEAEESPKEKMTLMERLASMSPIEDAKKAKIILDNSEEKNIPENNDIKENISTIEQTDSLEDMLRQIKEKDQREVEKVLMQKEMQVEKEDTNVQMKEKTSTREKINEDKKNNRIVNVLNIIIVVLVVIFIVLCAMIAYQLFF